VVRANGLNTSDLLTALRAGRAYVARSADVALSLEAGDDDRRAGIGDRLDAGGTATVTVELTVRGAPGALATLHDRDGQVCGAPVDGEGATLRWSVTAAGRGYLRAEVRDEGGSMVAFTNPVRLA
jgi:hypothetical protein